MFVALNPKFTGKRIALWRERLYCTGKYGCAANPTAINSKHKCCAVEIICTIWADKPDFMEIKYQGEHGPHHKPPTSAVRGETKLTYEVLLLLLPNTN
jgi:hypothetical protein